MPFPPLFSCNYTNTNYRWLEGKCPSLYWLICIYLFYKSSESKIQHWIHLFGIITLSNAIIIPTQGHFKRKYAGLEPRQLHPYFGLVQLILIWRICKPGCTHCKLWKMKSRPFFQKWKSHAARHLWALTGQSSAHKHMWSFIPCLLRCCKTANKN